MLREYLKGQVNELEISSNNITFRDLYRGLNEFKERLSAWS
jgi:hypothetical protein